MYWIEETNTSEVVKILKNLEDHAAEYDIKTMSICDGSISDVIVDRGTLYPSDGDKKRHNDIMSGKSIYEEEYNNLYFLNKMNVVSGFKLLQYQLHAVISIRLNQTSYALIAIQLIILIVYLSMTYALNLFNDETNLGKYSFLLENFEQTHTLIDIRNSAFDNGTRDYYDSYQKIIFWKGTAHGYTTMKNTRLEDFVLSRQSNRVEGIHITDIISGTFTKDYLIAWFNNYPLHTAPISINHMHNSILM